MFPSQSCQEIQYVISTTPQDKRKPDDYTKVDALKANLIWNSKKNVSYEEISGGANLSVWSS